MKKSELIKIIKEEITSILSEQARPQVQDLNGKPAIDLGTKNLRKARMHGNVLGDILRKHLKEKGLPLGTRYTKGPKGNFFITATGQ